MFAQEKKKSLSVTKPLKWFCLLLVLLASVMLFAHNGRPFIPRHIKPRLIVKPKPVNRLLKPPIKQLFFNPADIVINQCGNAAITLPTAADTSFNSNWVKTHYPNGPTWSDGSTGNSLTVTAAGTYYWQRTAANSVVNGDFSSGLTGFTSSYTVYNGPPNATALYAAGTYTVGTNPFSYHSGFASFGDHTTGTGNMLIVNGSDNPNTIVWQENITVKANTNYVFSFWAANASSADITNNNTSILQFTLTNGSTTSSLGTITLSTTDALGAWQYFNTTWNSGSITGPVTIDLVNNNTNTVGGNDFAVDDIMFAEVYRQQYDITMNPIPVLSVVSAICGVPSYNLQNTIIGYDPVTYTYTFKDSSGNVLSGTQITAAPVGTYSITETNNATGCTSTSQNVTVTINPVPPLSVTSPVSACASYDLKNAINGYDATTYTYTYSSGSSVVTASGTYTITATNNATGCTSSVPATVTINPLPTFTATSPTLACGTASYDLSAAISGAGGTYTYTYQDSGGNTLGSSTVTTSGTYTIIATGGGCTTTHSVTVSFNPIPVVTVVSPVCINGGARYNLENAVIGYNPATYNYTFKRGGTTLSGGQITNANTNTYTVTETNIATGCTSASKTIVVQNGTPPTFTVTSPTLACGVTSHNLSADISGAGGAYTYTYMDSGGNTLGSSTVTTSGTYYIIASAGGCETVSPQSDNVTFKPAPAFTATSPTLACGVTSYDLSTAISGAGGTYTYTYQDSGGNTLGSSTVTTSGTYTIIATNSVSGCTTPATVTVTFILAPALTISSPQIACGSFDLHSAINSPDPTVTYTYSSGGSSVVTTSGPYTITATKNGCSTTATVIVTINAIPVLAVTSPPAQCGGTYDLKNAITGYDATTYTYTYKNGATTLGSSVVSASGTYTITETNIATNCVSAPQNVIVTINAIPVLAVTSPPAQCGGTYDLKNAITGYDATTYTYTYKNGATTLGSSVVSASGTYTITETNIATNCVSAPQNVTVTINAIPVLAVTSPPAQCGGTYDLKNAITGYDATTYTYTYKNGATTLGSSVVSASGTYTITETNIATGCVSAPQNVTVTINAIPVLAVTSPPAQCGGTYDLKNAITGYDATTYTYTYKNGATTLGSSIVSASGTYTITETNIATNCVSAPQNVTVTINAIPVLVLTSPHAVCVSYDLTTAITGYDPTTYTYTFLDPSNNVLTLANAQTITQSGTYTVTETKISTGCQSSPQTTTITITPNPAKPGITSL